MNSRRCQAQCPLWVISGKTVQDQNPALSALVAGAGNKSQDPSKAEPALSEIYSRWPSQSSS